MKNLEINPVYWRLETLLACQTDTVHELACKAAGTLTSYRLIVGRCLLALDETGRYRDYGCSTAMHYATNVLGLALRGARSARLVAKRLRWLPRLTVAAENGTIPWSKLREISRRATLETEDYWLELAGRHSYREVEFLVSRTPADSIPGEVCQESESVKTELRCPLSPDAFRLLEQAKRKLSAERTTVPTTAELLEWVLTSYVADQPMSEEALEKSRAEIQKDKAAEEARQHPLVWNARELALRMGLLGSTDNAEVPSDEEALASAVGLPSADMVTPRASQNCDPCGSKKLQTALKTGRPARVDQPWKNERLRFNPKARHTTKAQKKELMRRDGYRCQTPGCPNHVWLQVHHLRAFKDGGETTRWNLVCLCTGCHRNVHDGAMIVERLASGELMFTDRHGRRLDRAYDIEFAGWLNYWLGWKGSEWDSHLSRVMEGTWSVVS